MKLQYAKHTALVVIGACTLAACTKPAATADTAKIADTIKADAAQLVEHFNARDAEKAVSHDAPDYVGMFHGTPNVEGPAADLALTKLQVADPASKIAVSNETVDVASAGDMAVYRATYAYTMTDPATKKIVTENGNWLLGYKPQPDGAWKIAWAVVSDTGPAPAAPAAK